MARLLILFFLMRFSYDINSQSALDSQYVKTIEDSISYFENTHPQKSINILTQNLILLKDNHTIKLKWHERRITLSVINLLFSDSYIYLSEYEKTINGLPLKEQNIEFLKYLVWKGFYYYQIGDLVTAKSIFNEIVKKSNALPNQDNYKSLMTAYANLSDIETKSGNFTKSIEYWVKFVTIYNNFINKKNAYLDAFHANLILKKGDINEAQSLIDKAISKINAKSLNRMEIKNSMTIYDFACDIYSKLGKKKKVKDFLDKKLALTYQKNFLDISNFNIRLADYYSDNIPKSILILRNALKLKLNYLNTNRHSEISYIHFKLAKIYIKNKDIKNLFFETQSAIIALSQTFNSTNYQDNPTISDVFSKKDLLETLDFKAGLLLDMAKMQPQYLDAAYNTAQLAAQLIDTIRADYTSDFDKQYLAEWSYGVYEKAINAAYLRYQKEGTAQYLYAAFNALERSKAIVLLEALRTGQAENALSDDDRNRLYQYKAELQKLETQIYTETTQNKKTPDAPSVRSLQNRLFETRQQYETLVKSFETHYPDYFRVKYGQRFAQLADIQRLLPQNGASAVLEYFVGNDALFTFVITKNNCSIYKTDKPKDFDTRIETMRQTLTQQHGSTDFIPQAVWLYDILLKQPLQSPALAYNTGLKKLIIVPDGILHYVPFEMLVESSTPSVFSEKKYAKIPYLIKKYTIGYAYSGNLLLMQNQKSAVLPTHLFAAFAPQYKTQDAAINDISRNTRAALTRDNAYDLPYAQKEVAQIHSIMGGHQYIGNQAQERVFKAKAEDYRILHFAMHAMPDSLNPLQSRLLFNYNTQDSLEDHDVTAAEIYALRLNADLAVLSACQTGYGKINRGEGVLSLSRAFAYSGAKATVMSQWVVNDFATQEIMVDFYKNLKAGKSKDEALRNAKLAYIDKHPESALRTPYYWAGFVVAGNMSPLDIWDAHSLRLIVAGILAFIVIVILVLRKKTTAH